MRLSVLLSFLFSAIASQAAIGGVVSGNGNVTLLSVTNALLVEKPWGVDHLFFDDFRRTNCTGTNLGTSLSGHRYGYVASDFLGIVNWQTNLIATNGTLSLKMDNGYPAPGGGAVYCGVQVADGPVNTWGMTLHCLDTTNTAQAFAATPCAVLIVQDEVEYDNTGVLLLASNYVHCMAQIVAGATILQVSVGTPGIRGIGSLTLQLNKTYPIPLNPGRGQTNGSTFPFSVYWPGNSTMVIRCGDINEQISLPWIDACRGTNCIFEFIPQLNTNWMRSALFAHQFWGGWTPSQPRLIQTQTTNTITLTAGCYTNLYTDTIVPIPANTTRTNRLNPAQNMPGRSLTIYDNGLSASGTNIWILTTGADKIGSGVSTNITTDGGAITLFSDGAVWHVLSRF